MRFPILLALLFFVVGIFFSFHIPPVFGDPLDDINKQLGELTRAREMSIAATQPLESRLNTLEKQLADIKRRVAAIEADLARKKLDLEKAEEDIIEKEEEFTQKVRKTYMRSYLDIPILSFFSQEETSDLTLELAYRRAQTNKNKEEITILALWIKDLEERRTKLENESVRLVAIKAKVDEESGFLKKEVAGAKAYQSKLTSQIADLTAQQQQIISQRLGNLNIPRSAGTAAAACTDDRNIDPGFSPRIAFFTYGVPNRTGLNQYGADGRARAGQNVETILSAYYQNYELKKDYSTDITINVEGHGGYNIEEYTKRIYEMPNSFAMEALKAQAIAARSYALAYTNNGSGSICTTQSCQVFKPEKKGGAWEEAVNATRGWVMVSGGSPVKTWYSSTHGGYIFSTSELPGWSGTSWTKHATDTTSGSAGSFSDLQSNAYDRNSPWFYCDWGSRSQYNKTAWLKPSEVADIVNIVLLARADSSTKDHFYQTDKSHPYGGEVWNEERVKSELRSRNITPFNSVSDISVSADFGSGRTSSISFSGDGGSQSFSGSEFKDWFNLRAPANIQIVGPLYNIERK